LKIEIPHLETQKKSYCQEVRVLAPALVAAEMEALVRVEVAEPLTPMNHLWRSNNIFLGVQNLIAVLSCIALFLKFK
jgi:hypothetical protein